MDRSSLILSSVVCQTVKTNYPSIQTSIHELDDIKRIPQNYWRMLHDQLQDCRNKLHLVKTIQERVSFNGDSQYISSIEAIVNVVQEEIDVVEKKSVVVLEYYKKLLDFFNESYEHLCIDEFFYHFACFLDDFDDEMELLSHRITESSPSIIPEILEVESVDSDVSIDSDLLQ